MTQILQSDLNGQSTVAAVFDTVAEARAAVEALKAQGFAESDLGIAVRGRSTDGKLHGPDDISTATVLEGEAVSGGLMGGFVGLLVGLGALAIPGVGPVVAGGIFSSVLGATAVGAGLGAVGGGIIGALVHLGVPEHEAEYFASGFHAGGTIVTVSAGGRAHEARVLLEHAGGDTGAQQPA